MRKINRRDILKLVLVLALVSGAGLSMAAIGRFTPTHAIVEPVYCGACHPDQVRELNATTHLPHFMGAVIEGAEERGGEVTMAEAVSGGCMMCHNTWANRDKLFVSGYDIEDNTNGGSNYKLTINDIIMSPTGSSQKWEIALGAAAGNASIDQTVNVNVNNASAETATNLYGVSVSTPDGSITAAVDVLSGAGSTGDEVVDTHESGTPSGNLTLTTLPLVVQSPTINTPIVTGDGATIVVVGGSENGVTLGSANYTVNANNITLLATTYTNQLKDAGSKVNITTYTYKKDQAILLGSLVNESTVHVYNSSGPTEILKGTNWTIASNATETTVTLMAAAGIIEALNGGGNVNITWSEDYQKQPLSALPVNAIDGSVKVKNGSTVIASSNYEYNQTTNIVTLLSTITMRALEGQTISVNYSVSQYVDLTDVVNPATVAVKVETPGTSGLAVDTLLVKDTDYRLNGTLKGGIDLLGSGTKTKLLSGTGTVKIAYNYTAAGSLKDQVIDSFPSTIDPDELVVKIVGSDAIDPVPTEILVLDTDYTATETSVTLKATSNVIQQLNAGAGSVRITVGGDVAASDSVILGTAVDQSSIAVKVQIAGTSGIATGTTLVKNTDYITTATGFTLQNTPTVLALKAGEAELTATYKLTAGPTVSFKQMWGELSSRSPTEGYFYNDQTGAASCGNPEKGFCHAVETAVALNALNKVPENRAKADGGQLGSGSGIYFQHEMAYTSAEYAAKQVKFCGVCHFNKLPPMTAEGEPIRQDVTDGPQVYRSSHGTVYQTEITTISADWAHKGVQCIRCHSHAGIGGLEAETGVRSN